MSTGTVSSGISICVYLSITQSLYIVILITTNGGKSIFCCSEMLSIFTDEWSAQQIIIPCMINSSGNSNNNMHFYSSAFEEIMELSLLFILME